MEKNRKRAVREAPEVRKEQILQSAITCLSQKGRRGFTVTNVAIEARISPGLVSHYFGSMEDLLQDVFAAVMFKMPTVDESEAASLEEAIAALLATIDATFAPDYYSRENLLVWLPLYEEMYLNGPLGKRLNAQEHQYVRAVERQFAAIARFRGLTVDTVLLASDFMAFLDGLWLHWCFSGRDDYGANRESALRYLELHLGALR